MTALAADEPSTAFAALQSEVDFKVSWVSSAGSTKLVFDLLRGFKIAGLTLVALMFLALVISGFLMLTSVETSNISSRAAVVCHAYRLDARHLHTDKLEYALMRNIDCSCVVRRMREQKLDADYAQFLEHIRVQIVEGVKASIRGEDYASAEVDPAITSRVMQSLLMSGVFCQSGLGGQQALEQGAAGG